MIAFFQSLSQLPMRQDTSGLLKCTSRIFSQLPMRQDTKKLLERESLSVSQLPMRQDTVTNRLVNLSNKIHIKQKLESPLFNQKQQHIEIIVIFR